MFFFCKSEFIATDLLKIHSYISCLLEHGVIYVALCHNNDHIHTH